MLKLLISTVLELQKMTNTNQESTCRAVSVSNQTVMYAPLSISKAENMNQIDSVLCANFGIKHQNHDTIHSSAE